MKVLAKNRRATFDYKISDKLIAGLVLSGAEVKSIKAGHVSLSGSYVNVLSGEAFLVGAHVNPYQSSKSGDPERTRKLLLHRSQINKLMDERQAGLSAVPLALLEQKGLIKLEVGIGQGKKAFDKRESLKTRQFQREQSRQIKR